MELGALLPPFILLMLTLMLTSDRVGLVSEGVSKSLAPTNPGLVWRKRVVMKKYGMVLANARTGETHRTMFNSSETNIDRVTEVAATRALHVSGVQVLSGWAPGKGKDRVRASLMSARRSLGVTEWYERSILTPGGGLFVVALFETL